MFSSAPNTIVLSSSRAAHFSSVATLGSTTPSNAVRPLTATRTGFRKSNTDGDNSSEADSRECVKILKEQLLPTCNMFGYCQVASAYGSGNFINVLHEHLRNHEKVLTSRVNSKDDIYDSIKTFFGKGH